MHRYCLALCTLLIVSSPVLAAGQSGPGCTGAGTMDDTTQLGHFDVIENSAATHRTREAARVCEIL